MIEEYMVYIWLGIFVISLIVEACTFELVSIWFCLGSLVDLICSFIPNLVFYYEIIIFFAISIITLLSFRPLANKTLKRKITKSNIDEIIGQKGIVTKKIDDLNGGEVKIRDVIWTALPYKNDIIILEGEKIEVISLKGNKLYVKPIDQTSRKEN